MSDNVDATASLGASEELSVQNSVSDPIPAFSQPPEQGSKGTPFVDSHDVGDVLPDDPSWTKLASDFTEAKREVSTRVIQSLSETLHAEGLAGSSADKNVN